MALHHLGRGRGRGFWGAARRSASCRSRCMASCRARCSSACWAARNSASCCALITLSLTLLGCPNGRIGHSRAVRNDRVQSFHRPISVVVIGVYLDLLPVDLIHSAPRSQSRNTAHGERPNCPYALAGQLGQIDDSPDELFHGFWPGQPAPWLDSAGT